MHVLGPPLESLEYGYPFSVVYFNRGTLPTKKGVRKGTQLGDLDVGEFLLARIPNFASIATGQMLTFSIRGAY